jgi:hypothetical protein
MAVQATSCLSTVTGSVYISVPDLFLLTPNVEKYSLHYKTAVAFLLASTVVTVIFAAIVRTALPFSSHSNGKHKLLPVELFPFPLFCTSSPCSHTQLFFSSPL